MSAPQVLSLPGVSPELAAALADGMGRGDALLRATVDHDDPYVAAASAHLLAAGGKRFRPTLTLLAAQVCRGVTDEVIAAAVGVELTHLASLYHDDVIVGGGGAGLRAAIAVAESDPALKIALISKVYPMRSHTVAAEGGSAGVKLPTDSLEYHFNDTVGGGDWLCEQDVVEYFVAHCNEELTQLEHWGCPWSRTPDGHVFV